MKAHIGADRDSGLVHTVTGTAANVSDISQTPNLLQGEERAVWADAGYVGVDKREDVKQALVTKEQEVEWHHENVGRRIRAMLQRPDCGGHEKPADRENRHRAGDQRQTTGQPHAGTAGHLAGATGKPTTRVADTGYYSEANVKACGKHLITPLIAVKREAHHPDPMERYTEPPPLAVDATEVEIMRHALQTKAGRALYAQRKCTVEPVIGIIKSVLGFRQFMLRVEGVLCSVPSGRDGVLPVSPRSAV